MSSFRLGMETLPRALAQHLAGRIFLGHCVEAVDHKAGGGYRVKVRHGSVAQWAAGRIIVALPAHVAAASCAALTEIAGAPRKSAIHRLPWCFSVTGRVYRASTGRRGVLAPAVENAAHSECCFHPLVCGTGAAGARRAHRLVGGARQPQLALLEPDELHDPHGEVQQRVGGRAPPLMARTHCWRHGLPQPGLTTRSGSVESRCVQPNTPAYSLPEIIFLECLPPPVSSRRLIPLNKLRNISPRARRAADWSPDARTE